MYNWMSYDDVCIITRKKLEKAPKGVLVDLMLDIATKEDLIDCILYAIIGTSDEGKLLEKLRQYEKDLIDNLLVSEV